MSNAPVRLNWYVASLWWFIGLCTFGGSFWFPYDWHSSFPEEGWLNIGILYMILFWCFTGICVLKGIEWGIRMCRVESKEADRERT